MWANTKVEYKQNGQAKLQQTESGAGLPGRGLELGLGNVLY